jgi:hypothetical protein
MAPQKPTVQPAAGKKTSKNSEKVDVPPGVNHELVKQEFIKRKKDFVCTNCERVGRWTTSSAKSGLRFQCMNCHKSCTPARMQKLLQEMSQQKKLKFEVDKNGQGVLQCSMDFGNDVIGAGQNDVLGDDVVDEALDGKRPAELVVHTADAYAVADSLESVLVAAPTSVLCGDVTLGVVDGNLLDHATPDDADACIAGYSMESGIVEEFDLCGALEAVSDPLEQSGGMALCGGAVSPGAVGILPDLSPGQQESGVDAGTASRERMTASSGSTCGTNPSPPGVESIPTPTGSSPRSDIPWDLNERPIGGETETANRRIRIVCSDGPVVAINEKLKQENTDLALEVERLRKQVADLQQELALAKQGVFFDLDVGPESPRCSTDVVAPSFSDARPKKKVQAKSVKPVRSVGSAHSEPKPSSETVAADSRRSYAAVLGSSQCLPTISEEDLLRKLKAKPAKGPKAKEELGTVYFSGVSRMRIGELRATLRSLNVDLSGVYNISYVGRETVEILVSVSAKERLVQDLEKKGLRQRLDFDPSKPSDPAGHVPKGLSDRIRENFLARLTRLSENRVPLVRDFFRSWLDEHVGPKVHPMEVVEHQPPSVADVVRPVMPQLSSARPPVLCA